MSVRKPPNYARLAAAIVVAGMVIAVAIISVRYSIVTTVTTATTTVTPTAGARLYEVVFKQPGVCSPPAAYAAPWSVTLGPWTVVEPPDAGTPVDTISGSASPAFVNYSEIVFSVPPGTYPYAIAIGWPIGNPSGYVQVNGSDVMVLVYPEVGCTIATPTG